MFSLRSAIVDNLKMMSCKLNCNPFGLRPLSSAEASLRGSEAGKKKNAHGERWEGGTLVIVSILAASMDYGTSLSIIHGDTLSSDLFKHEIQTELDDTTEFC